MTQRSAPLDLMAQHMAKAATDRGIQTSVVTFGQREDGAPSKPWLQFDINDTTYLYARGALAEAGEGRPGLAGRNINHQAVLLMADKHKLKAHLAEQGFSVPRGQMYRRRKISEARAAFDDFSGPVCVKPNNGSEGKCVFPDIHERRFFDAALDAVAANYPTIIVEQSVSGTHYRFFYVAPHVVGIRMGRPAEVFGDGVSTIAQLIAAKNQERQKRGLPTHPPIEIDSRIEDYLAMQNLQLATVLPAGARAGLCGASNATAGADTILINEGVHPSYRQLVEAACKTLPGLYVSGIDIVIENPAEPATDDNYWFIELNGSPALSGFYYPWEGQVVDVAGHILDHLIRRAPKDAEHKRTATRGDAQI